MADTNSAQQVSGQGPHGNNPAGKRTRALKKEDLAGRRVLDVQAEIVIGEGGVLELRSATISLEGGKCVHYATMGFALVLPRKYCRLYASRADIRAGETYDGETRA